MKYTRKEILKNATIAGLAIFTPSLLTMINNYYKSETEKKTTFEEDLNAWLKSLTENSLKIDVLIINDKSIKDFDFVFLTYNRETDDAPTVVIPKNENYHPDSNQKLFADVNILKKFSKENDIFIWHEKGNDFTNKLIRKIRKCGQYNYIADDLYRPVAQAYASKNEYDRNKNKLLA